MSNPSVGAVPSEASDDVQMCSNCKRRPVARVVQCGFNDWCEHCDLSLFSHWQAEGKCMSLLLLRVMMSSIYACTSASESCASSTDDDEDGWEVAEILAERTTTSGENEFLVVWKPTWLPESNIVPNGPAMLSFKLSTKISYSHSTSKHLRVILPVEARTRVDQEHSTLQAEAAARAERKQHRRQSAVRQLDAPSAAQGAVINPSPTGPRKRLSLIDSSL